MEAAPVDQVSGPWGCRSSVIPGADGTAIGIGPQNTADIIAGCFTAEVTAAELLFSLAAFEKYSSECESLNVEDSELHAYLSKTASKARHMIENALDKVIEAENIQI